MHDEDADALPRPKKRQIESDSEGDGSDDDDMEDDLPSVKGKPYAGRKKGGSGRPARKKAKDISSAQPSPSPVVDDATPVTPPHRDNLVMRNNIGSNEGEEREK